jgi:hypothetical protein
MGREATLARAGSSVSRNREVSQSDESEEEEGEISVQEDWETSVGDVGILLEQVKENLAQIDPGIGDRITLAKFCSFIEANSTALK